MSYLTGNVRVTTRKKIFGGTCKVIQVEEVIQSQADLGYGLLPEFVKIWRDATPAEIKSLNLAAMISEEIVMQVDCKG
jgi:hypothetical protein